jgi:hypothetical protein
MGKTANRRDMTLWLQSLNLQLALNVAAKDYTGTAYAT